MGRPRALRVQAQQPGRVYRVGLLSGAASVSPTDERYKALVARLSARGFAEGKNVILEQRWAEAHTERLGGLHGRLALLEGIEHRWSFQSALRCLTAPTHSPILSIQYSRSFTRKRAIDWLCSWHTRDSVTFSTAAISFRFMSCS